MTLVETSPTLAEIQHETLLTSGAPIAWAATLAEAPRGPAIVIANEFLDALPVRQYVRSGGRWRERVVWLDKAGELAFALGARAGAVHPGAGRGRRHPRSQPGRASAGVRTRRRGSSNKAASRCSSTMATRFTAIGDTLQAVRGHRIVDPLVDPGEADLTAHVDFAAMARSARAAGAAVYGPIDQGDFLRAIGIDARTRALAERASPDRAGEFELARQRLVGKNDGEMGALFKAMAIATATLPAPPGFDDRRRSDERAESITLAALDLPGRAPCVLHARRAASPTGSTPR